jgi:hypothetical protein
VDFCPRLSRTRSLDVDYQISPGREQQVNKFPAVGRSSGPGSYFTALEINPHSQVWQTPVRHDQRIPERLVMAMTGHKAWAMFDRYSIASTDTCSVAPRAFPPSAIASICFRRCTLSLQPGIPRPTQLLRRYGVGWAMIAAEEASADLSAARPDPTRLRHAGSNFQGPHCGPRS